MSAPYIFPHMRTDAPSDPSSTAQDPSKPPRKPSDGYDFSELAHQFNFTDANKLGTLNRGPARSDGTLSLGFIIVFKNQHPNWPPQIFCKSDLHLLPKNAEAMLPSPPITVFFESERKAAALEPIFVFAGPHSITAIKYLAPRSDALVKLLETKFTGPKNERSADAWQKSLTLKWAVLDLERVGGQGENPMEPLTEVRKKTVSELLEELRLKGKENGEAGAGGGRGDATMNGDGTG